MADEGKVGILGAISNWLKLLGYIVIAAEGIILVAMQLTPATNPFAPWYPLFMLVFLLVIVVGVFIDRYIQSNTQRLNTKLTLELEGKKVSMQTSQIATSMGNVTESETEIMFSDSRNGFMFPQPKLPQWSKPQFLNAAEVALRMGITNNMDNWEAAKEALSIRPLGKMFAEAEYVLFEYGEPLEIGFNAKSSTKAVDKAIENLVSYLKKNKKEATEEVTEEVIDQMRKELMWGNIESDLLKISNSFTVTVFDKNHAKNEPTAPTLGNVFITQSNMAPSSVERLVANDKNILWGVTTRFTNVMANGKPGEVTMFRWNSLIDSPDRVYLASIVFSPQTEQDIGVWDELKDMLESFKVIV